MKHIKVQLQVKKDDTSTKLRSFAYLESPSKLLQMMVENSYMDGSFRQSETWMNGVYASKIVVTYNIDKGGNDIIASIRLLNRETGNSMEFTFPIAMVLGPACESYFNTGASIFDRTRPTQPFLQHLAFDSYLSVTVLVDSQVQTLQVHTLVFLPTPTQERLQNRQIEANLSDESVEAGAAFQFNPPESSNGGPPEVSIPLDAVSVDFKFITKAGDRSIAVGLQFLVGGTPVHSLRFRKPITLSTGCDVKVLIQQVMGFGSNDGKQGNQVMGGIGCQSKYCCPGCGQPRASRRKGSPAGEGPQDPEKEEGTHTRSQTNITADGGRADLRPPSRP